MRIINYSERPKELTPQEAGINVTEVYREATFAIYAGLNAEGEREAAETLAKGVRHIRIALEKANAYAAIVDRALPMIPGSARRDERLSLAYNVK